MSMDIEVRGEVVEARIESPGIRQLVELAIEKNVSVDALEKLLGMQERVMARDARLEFIQAMRATQDDLGPLKKTRKVSFRTRQGKKVEYDFASLDEIERVLRPVASKYGLSYTWDLDLHDDVMKATCKVSHVSGHTETSSFASRVEQQATMNTVQATAATGTYAKRQSLCSAFGLSTAESDTDGQVADSEAAPDPISESELADLIAKRDEVLGSGKRARERFEAWCEEAFGTSMLGDLSRSQMREVLDMLERKRRGSS